ncbi:phospholipid scramblase 1-like isoform X1 [Trichogramma pretiosum]|uniref:phospholipid scramblase 1-like isoform X1 n=2 Tax=Trichogramma pretiosum TaxID=7493 RepID=UPI0006C9D763|nr:phospholipid scramblase 1-like isoform X1 [Trichogramma pretiosum]
MRKMRAPAPPPSAPPPPEGWHGNTTILPPGLLSLMRLDRLFVEHELPAGIEALRRLDNERRYRVTTAEGEHIYSAIEESSACGRCCLGRHRDWDFHLVEQRPATDRREVLRIARSRRCESCFFPCCLQEMSVYDSASGELLGTLAQNWNALRPSFSVRDAYGEPVLGLKGPLHLRCCGPRELDFIINSTGKQQSSVGVITKKWSSDLARSFFKDGQSIGIGFPVDLDVKIKAVLLGACFLIDFMYFEDNDNGRRRNNHRSCS